MIELFYKPDTPLHAYPFDRIREEYFLPALREAIARQYTEIKAIETCPEPPTFANTVEALEEAGAELSWVASAFYNLHAVCSTPGMIAIAEEIAPEMSKLSSYIALSKPLFQRIEHVYKEREHLSLSPEQLRLLTLSYEGFLYGGARLEGADRTRYEQLSERLSLATLAFSNNVLHDENIYRLPVKDESAVAPLPEPIKQIARERAKREASEASYLFSLAAPEIGAILKFSPNEELRKEIYTARMMRGLHEGAHYNPPLVEEIANLRLELAHLLGFPTYAHFALRRRMLRHPREVEQLLDKLTEAYTAQAEKEMAQLAALAGGPIEPWSYAYYAELLRQRDYDFSEESMRPYFPLSAVIEGVFGLAHRLYGLTFTQETELPVYHPDVRVYRVENPQRGELIGLLYLDFFPREGKESGAWMNNLVEQSHEQRPHIILVMNFTPPTSDSPSLLLPSEVHTFLHEFGHALHGLLSQTHYESLSGTSVVRDFVELPSQIMENWLFEPEFLSGFARHYKTGDPLPAELVDKLRRTEHFMVGYSTIRQLYFGYLDMAFHHREQPVKQGEVETIERQATTHLQTLPPIPKGLLIAPSFGHIFSGGYAAGYYSYKWSEVLAADAFARFQEEGIFDKTVASSFRENILERGDTAEAADLYRAFRGRDASITALLRQHGVGQ